ncbi:MAG: nuclear transport factor 2 family protein [Nitrososphaerales archaeon]
MDPLSTAEVEVMKVVEDNVEAERNGDVGFLEHNLSDNFLGISPSGFVMTKEEWLAGHSPSNFKYSNLRLQEKKFRIYGSYVAILTARQISSATLQGRELEGDFRVTEVFVNQKGHWLLANRQLSPIQQPPKFN